MILIKDKFPSNISLVSRRVLSENNWQSVFGQGHYWFYERDLISLSSQLSGWLTYQSYYLQILYWWKRNLFSCFPAYNIYIHRKQDIASGIYILFSINFTGTNTLIQFYITISRLIHDLLSSGLRPTQNSESYWTNISTTMIGSEMNHFSCNLIYIQ